MYKLYIYESQFDLSSTIGPTIESWIGNLNHQWLVRYWKHWLLLLLFLDAWNLDDICNMLIGEFYRGL